MGEAENGGRPIPAWLALLDHTADEGVDVRAGSMQELFARAAWAMFRLLTDMRCVRAAETMAVSVEASDREALMVRWLSELNYLHQAKHKVFCRFEVREISDTRLIAKIGGEAIGPEHRVFKEIKAVTFHGLRVEERDGEWCARILFDV